MSIISVSCLGSFGRWGNMLFQYCVARAYAEKIGAELVTPDWPGRRLFKNINERIINDPIGDRFENEVLDGSTNKDMYGYFQRLEHMSLLSRSKIKSWLQPIKQYVGYDLVFHKRRGDYISSGCFALVSDFSYENACIKYGYDIKKAIIFSDDRKVESQYDDFFSIMNSKVIFRANSTYSWWAAVLSNAEIYSPVVEDKTGWIDCEFVKGNHPRIMYLFQDLILGD